MVRALDGDEEAARFGAEVKVKITAPQQPVPPPKMPGFPYAPAEFEGLTITPYANARGRVAYGFRARGMRAPAGIQEGKTTPSAPATARNAA